MKNSQNEKQQADISLGHSQSEEKVIKKHIKVSSQIPHVRQNNGHQTVGTAKNKLTGGP